MIATGTYSRSEENKMLDFNEFNAFDIANAVHRFELIMNNSGGVMDSQDRMHLALCLGAADGVNGNPKIDWPNLMAANNEEFVNDITLIFYGLDKDTGTIDIEFMPKFIRRH